MKTELLPIIAAYLGQKCSYDETETETDLEAWYELANLEHLKDFKLHLRKPKSITDEELRILSGKISGLEREPEREGIRRFVKDNDLDVIVSITSSVIELGESYVAYFAEATNYLRSIGICIDQCLVNENLVEWKK